MSLQVGVQGQVFCKGARRKIWTTVPQIEDSFRTTFMAHSRIPRLTSLSPKLSIPTFLAPFCCSVFPASLQTRV